MATRHIVQPGECVSSIAAEHGLLPTSIWDHQENAALKVERDDPYVLCAGDKLLIPDRQQKWESVDTDKRHSFRRRGVPEKLNVQLVDEDDVPYSYRRYTIEVDGRVDGGETDSEGIVDHWIAPAAMNAVLTFALVEGESAPLGQR
jgi:N-acetylmuramoyl-L-alanine amidase